MPRFPTIPKTLHGEPVTEQQFQTAICDAILASEAGASASELIPLVGPEWEPTAMKKRLAQTLINLATRGVLSKVEGKVGVYQVNANRYRRAGVTKFDQDEKRIMQVIRARGGFATWAEIMEDMGCRPIGSKQARIEIQSMSEYRRVVDVLSKSERIRTDITTQGLGDGIYNLPWAEISTLPLIGKYASIYIHYTHNEIKIAHQREFQRHDWYVEQEMFFEQVGAAFERLRRTAGLSLEEVMDVKPVRAAVARFQQQADRPMAVIRGEWKDHRDIAIAKLREAALVDDGRPAYVRHEAMLNKVEEFREAQERVFETKRGQWLYRKFERGDVGAHYNAPLVFYRAVAEAFEVCPAALSRGVILLKPYPEKVQRANYRRTDEEIIDAELRMEAADEQRRRLFEFLDSGEVFTGEVPETMDRPDDV